MKHCHLDMTLSPQTQTDIHQTELIVFLSDLISYVPYAVRGTTILPGIPVTTVQLKEISPKSPKSPKSEFICLSSVRE